MDTIIRLQEAKDAEEKRDKPNTPYQKETVEAEADDMEDYFTEGVEYGMNCNCPYVITAEDTALVKTGYKIVAIDDEEVSFESVEGFLATLKDAAANADGGELIVEADKPMEKHVKRYRKVKKLGADVPIDWPEWETWYYKTQTSKARFEKLTPKYEKKRDTAIQACSETVESLDESDLKTQIADMLKRFGEPFTRNELAEYNFDVKKIVRQIQNKERAILADIKEAKKAEQADG